MLDDRSSRGHHTHLGLWTASCWVVQDLLARASAAQVVLSLQCLWVALWYATKGGGTSQAEMEAEDVTEERPQQTSWPTHVVVVELAVELLEPKEAPRATPQSHFLLEWRVGETWTCRVSTTRSIFPYHAHDRAHVQLWKAWEQPDQSESQAEEGQVRLEGDARTCMRDDNSRRRTVKTTH